MIIAVINTGYTFTESYLKMCSTKLDIVRRICHGDTSKYTKNFYEAQKKIYSLKSTKLCTQFPDLKKCTGNVLFYFHYIVLTNSSSHWF